MNTPENASTLGAVFLAGGGVSDQSAKFDAAFVAHCNTALPLIYIPNAMRAHPPEQSLAWFKSIMAPHGVAHIEMWDHLRPQHAPEDIARIYISGGDTVHLLDELLRTDFHEYLRAVVDAGNSVYGQSAGAIVLGKTLATSKAALAVGRGETPGLGLVPYAVACHYRADDDDRLAHLSTAKRHTIIAISDDAAALLESGKAVRFGDAPVSLFHPDGHRSGI